MRKRSFGFIATAILASLAILPIATPAQADTWPDAYTQIINHPVAGQTLPIKRDGAPTYLSNGQGRYYTGSTGKLEIRLTNAGTIRLTKFSLTAGSVLAGTALTGGVSTVGAAIVAAVPNATLRNTLGIAGIVVGYKAEDIQAAVAQLISQNKCLGVTIPPQTIDFWLTQAGYLITARVVEAFSGTGNNTIAVWLEPCTSQVLGDVWVPASFPGIEGALAAQPLATPPPTPSLFVTRIGNGINGKINLTGDWTWNFSATPVADVRVSGKRITYIDTNGSLWAKDGLTGTWYQEYGAVSQYAASSSLLVIRSGDTLYGKVNLTDNWVTLAGAVADVRVTGNRISYVDTGGNIWVKDGLYGGWIQEYSAVSQYAVSASLIVLRSGTHLFGKTCLTCGWVWGLNGTPATDVRVAGDRITYIDTNGHLYAKDGLTGTWYDEYPGVDQYAASSSLLVIRLGADLFGKAGLNDTWVLLNGTPATDVKVSGNRITYTDTNGHVWAKDGLYGTWYDQYSSVDQYATS